MHGEPLVWFTAAALLTGLALVLLLVGLIVWNGGRTFWPKDVVRYETALGEVVLGQELRAETWKPGAEEFELFDAEESQRRQASLDAAGGRSERRLIREVPRYDRSQTRTFWLSDFELAEHDGTFRWESAAERPEWALVVERYGAGRLYGELVGFVESGQLLEEDPRGAWERYEEERGEVRRLRSRRERIEQKEIGPISKSIERARVAQRSAQLEYGEGSHEFVRSQGRAIRVMDEGQLRIRELRAEAEALREQGQASALRVKLSDGLELDVPLWEVARAFAPNQLERGGKLALYLDRWREFLTTGPRNANQAGGVFPAIFGTIAMTLLMTLAVVPFGVLAALYLREYAGQGWIVRLVRIAVNNLAGVPSVVFGVFGLGFFCYIVGAGLDELLFAERLPNPTLGTKGLLWASLTLALLTLPVVIVATEEALSAVPNSMREGSHACGATKWQTIRRVVLPRALPGVLTGMILAVARGAGEVAPLMMLGAVKYAPELPVALELPAFGLERNFMHLGFHIYDLGYKSPDSDAAIPMVYTTALLLIAIITGLNLVGIGVRARLRKRHAQAEL
ncbi:MAG: phosphate ABC transporter permease PstA [Planctomycetota bacterium]|jgi:phosphate transport system permease protein